MKGSTVKCNLLMSKDKSSDIYLAESISKSSDYEKLLSIKIDSKLDHVQDLCKKANRKLRASTRANL